MSPTTFALLMLSAASFVLMVLVLFSKLAVTAAFLMWIVYFYQAPWLKRLGGYMLTTGLVSGGLVILCLGLDLSLGLMGYTATTLLSLTEQHIRLIILGSAMVFLPVIVAPEGGGSTGVLRENVNVIFSHRQHETRPARFLVVHREAGRLRRKVAATLFFKVFDPGGQLICLQGSSCF